MGKTPVNTALGSLRGQVDGWVYRELEGETVIARRPRVRADLEPTAEQQTVRETFRRAAEFAKAVFADPVRKAAYRDLALRRGVPGSRLFAFIVQDYAKGPVVTGIAADGYGRAIGDAIKVYATDNGEVTGVTVALQAADGSVIESGPAAKSDDGWRYLATTAVAAGDPVTIVATATDRAGQTGSLTVTVT